MKRSLAVLIVLLTLTFPAFAHAERVPFTPEAEAFYTNAIEAWGREPVLCGSINKSMETGVLISPTTPPGLEAWGLATEPGEPTKVCNITVKYGLEPWALCQVMQHEVGHLLGLGHSGDPMNIMYPQVNRYMVAPGCPSPPPLEEGIVIPMPPILEPEQSAVETSLNEMISYLKGKTARCNYLRHHSRSRNQKMLCWLNLREIRKEYREIAAA